jgi:hypothetical protein
MNRKHLLGGMLAGMGLYLFYKLTKDIKTEKEISQDLSDAEAMLKDACEVLDTTSKLARQIEVSVDCLNQEVNESNKKLQTFLEDSATKFNNPGSSFRNFPN